MVKVFFYGTLMHGHANHRVLVELGARRISAATTAAPRTLVDLGPYPALLAVDEARDRGAVPVAGELYELADDKLDELDAFEGCPELYRRERITLGGLGGDVEAWTYVLAGAAPSDARVIRTGRYAGGGVVLTVSARDVGLTKE